MQIKSGAELVNKKPSCNGWHRSVKWRGLVRSPDWGVCWGSRTEGRGGERVAGGKRGILMLTVPVGGAELTPQTPGESQVDEPTNATCLAPSASAPARPPLLPCSPPAWSDAWRPFDPTYLIPLPSWPATWSLYLLLDLYNLPYGQRYACFLQLFELWLVQLLISRNPSAWFHNGQIYESLPFHLHTFYSHDNYS